MLHVSAQLYRHFRCSADPHKELWRRTTWWTQRNKDFYIDKSKLRIFLNFTRNRPIGSEHTVCPDLYDMIRYYMIWYMIRYDMIWYDTIRYGTLWYDKILYDIWYMIRYMIWYMIWYDMIWYMIRYDMVRYDTIWYDIFVQLQVGCHPVAVVQYTFTHKQYNI